MNTTRLPETADQSPIEGYEAFQSLLDMPSDMDLATTATFLGARFDFDRYRALFAYFAEGFRHHATSDFSRVHYPGFASIRGYDVTGLEGFARTAPMLAAWLYGRNTPLVDLPSGPLDIAASLRSAILGGTDPKSPSYWGDIGTDDQRLVEMPDIVRTLWLSADFTWDRFSETERNRIIAWLKQAASAEITHRNNWVLFPAVVDAYLHHLGISETGTCPTYWEFKANYLESGWFFDAPHGVDYYNSWGVAYELFWINQFQPGLDRAFLKRALTNSGELTRHLISPKGVPIMGRSVGYRTAVPTAVLCAALLPNADMPLGAARHALNAVWRFFVSHDVLRGGTLTMGYFETDPRLIDDYTGPGSCHWGLRPLVLALMQPECSDFWQALPIPLPVETSDYFLDLPKLGWRVTGDHQSRDIIIEITANTETFIPLDEMSSETVAQEIVQSRPIRPANIAAKYKQRFYRALEPFPFVGQPQRRLAKSEM